MSFVTPTDYDITEALRLGGCAIYNYKDARNFLLTDGVGKRIADRFISYLICLKIIPPTRQKWTLGILKAIDLYYDHARKYFDKNFQNPLEILPVKEETVMRNDFPRTHKWFDEFANELGLDTSKIKDVELRISRIFAVMSKEHKNVHYTQGYDRYAFAFLGLGMAFCNLNEEKKISYDVAEALSYHLTNNIISLLPMATLLDKSEDVAAHFEKLDKVLMNYNRNQYLKVKNGGGSLVLFGVKWELVLFADDHTIDDTFRLWDQIFGRIESYEYVISAMTIAHISQVVIPENCVNVLECVAHFKDWNTTQLIATTNKLLDHRRSLAQNCCEYCCPSLPNFHGYEFSPFAFTK